MGLNVKKFDVKKFDTQAEPEKLETLALPLKVASALAEGKSVFRWFNFEIVVTPWAVKFKFERKHDVRN